MREDVQKLIEDINKLEKKYNMKLSIDQANPFDLVVRKLDNNETIVAWLGTSEVQFDTDYVIFNQN